ncbi:hypothetical protein ABU178_08485 [Pantoea osteomyelitidis]|uniref:Uncharacterized protein n=1 Tax=Pantoea osteomyelitidis TaxID=3230026 RepID=A0ABW7PWQ7_9GAMM
MAGLTKEQCALREAAKQEQAKQENTSTSQPPLTQGANNNSENGAGETSSAPDAAKEYGQDLVAMFIDAPAFPGGPQTADVHPDEVDNWKSNGWKET